MKRRSFLQILGFLVLGELASPVLASTARVVETTLTPGVGLTLTGRIINIDTPAFQDFPSTKSRFDDINALNTCKIKDSNK